MFDADSLAGAGVVPWWFSASAEDAQQLVVLLLLLGLLETRGRAHSVASWLALEQHQHPSVTLLQPCDRGLAVKL